MTQRTGDDMEDITYRSAVATDEVVNNSLKAKPSQQVHWLAFLQASPEDMTGFLPSWPLVCFSKVPAQQMDRENGWSTSSVQAGHLVEAHVGVLSTNLPE